MESHDYHPRQHTSQDGATEVEYTTEQPDDDERGGKLAVRVAGKAFVILEREDDNPASDGTGATDAA